MLIYRCIHQLQQLYIFTITGSSNESSADGPSAGKPLHPSTPMLQAHLAALAGVEPDDLDDPVHGNSQNPLQVSSEVAARLADRWSRVQSHISGGRICSCCGETGIAIPAMVTCSICKQTICFSCVGHHCMVLWPDACACLMRRSEYPDSMIDLMNHYLLQFKIP